MIPEHHTTNFECFRDCLSEALIEKLAIRPPKPRRRGKGRKNENKPPESAESATNDAEELGDFVAYVAEEIWPALPADLRTISYAAVQDDASLAEKYSVPLDSAVLEKLLQALPVSVTESLEAYGALSNASSLSRFLEPILACYLVTSAAAPPEYTPALMASRSPGCEICGREHLPLTYHHLIPRQAHSKAVKRGWHKEWELNKVAWLCRACHSFVHKIASNEELAKGLYTVDLLLEREDVLRWAQWVQRVRWKAR